MSEYGMPYMGSKDKIAASICMMMPKATHFYDLFGGGFSMTHCMIKRFPHKYSYFHYNEIKADIVELVKKAIHGDYAYSKQLPPWISREEFFEKKDTDAYIRCLWSFGNDQKTYLFGKDIEVYKKSAHEAVVFNLFDETAIKVLGFKVWPKEAKTITQKRFYWRQKTAFNSKGMKRGDLQRLERLEQLEQLQRLERLQQLQRLERLSFYSDSYENIKILDNSVVYCDIPYHDTRDYNNAFNRSKFLDWAASRDFPVYISEYNVDDDRFKCVYAIDKLSLLDNTGDKKKVKSEKLFWNQRPC